MPQHTDQHSLEFRDKIRVVVDRTLMRMPDNVDLLHLGDLLYEVWQEGYEAGLHDYPTTALSKTSNPFRRSAAD